MHCKTSTLPKHAWRNLGLATLGTAAFLIAISWALEAHNAGGGSGAAASAGPAVFAAVEAPN